jgi:integrase
VSGVREFFGWWGHETGLVDPAAGLPDVKKGVHAPRPAPTSAVAIGLAAGDDRTGLMLRLAVDVGLRRGEIARLRGDDAWLTGRSWSLRVHGKGSKDRVVPIDEWLALELTAAGGGWVFPSPVGGHLTPHHVGKLIARVLPDGYTAHQLRHRFATDLYAATRDIVVVQRFLGHSRPETTQTYVQLPDGLLRDGLAQLDAWRSVHSRAGGVVDMPVL